MALVKGVNSYGDLTEADDYFEDRLDVEAWSSASEPLKSQALLTAATVLELEPWGGVAVDEEQAMAFPREGYYFDPKTGTYRELSGTPDRLKKAQFELAYHFLNNDGILDDTGGLESLKIDTIELVKLRDAGLYPVIVRRLIEPLLSAEYHSDIWWRAN